MLQFVGSQLPSQIHECKSHAESIGIHSLPPKLNFSPLQNSNFCQNNYLIMKFQIILIWIIQHLIITWIRILIKICHFVTWFRMMWEYTVTERMSQWQVTNLVKLCNCGILIYYLYSHYLPLQYLKWRNFYEFVWRKIFSFVSHCIIEGHIISRPAQSTN